MPDGPSSEEERITVVAEGLKDLALRLQCPIIAIVAAEREGLVAGKRLRVNNLRGSSALAYEPDVILLMNDKYDVVARHHLVFDVGNAERFRSWAVMTIEKNRSGLDKIDLEFQKHFEQGRFERKGNVVSEQLVDERVFVDDGGPATRRGRGSRSSCARACGRRSRRSSARRGPPLRRPPG